MIKLETTEKILKNMPLLNNWIFDNGFDLSDFDDKEYAEMLTDLANGKMDYYFGGKM